MSARVTYIVGDYFMEFAKSANVMTCTTFLELLNDNQLNKNKKYVFGQGIPFERLTEILDSVDKKSGSICFTRTM